MFEQLSNRMASLVGIAPRTSDNAEHTGGTAGAGSPVSGRVAVRGLLLSEIADFMLANDLDLTAMNFDFARDIVSGSDARLKGALHDFLATGGRLGNASVQELVARTSPGKLTPEALIEMLTQVEAQTETLLGLTQQSRGSISDYSLELSRAASSAADTSGSGVVARLVSLTLSMVERTQAIEAEMHESNKQARRLKRSLDKARHAADHDALTGLPNRRAFERRLAEAATQAAAKGHPLAVAFCDIDHFKTINDGHGHATGDRVLCYVAELLARISGQHCHVARHGGEEFVMIFPGMDTAQAMEIVNAARLSLAERRLVNRDDGTSLPPVTFSAGVADVMAFATTSDALAAADAALYRAKESGRNQVLLAETILSDA